MAFTVYGIPNCDTVKKSRRWLDDQGVAFDFHDFRKDGLTAEQLSKWLDAVGAEKLVNKRGTTWRKLSDAEKAEAEQNPVPILLENPAIIKRPVIEGPHGISVGFTMKEQEALEDVL